MQEGGAAPVSKCFLFNLLPAFVGTAGARAYNGLWHFPCHLRAQSYLCPLRLVAISDQNIKGHCVSVSAELAYFEKEPSPSLSFRPCLSSICSFNHQRMPLAKRHSCKGPWVSPMPEYSLPTTTLNSKLLIMRSQVFH